jgi:hypothetical protein
MEETNIKIREIKVVLQQLCLEILDLHGDQGSDLSFTELGGNSMDAMRLVATAYGEGISIAVLDVFETSSFSELAHRAANLDSTSRGGQDIERFALVPTAIVSADVVKAVENQFSVQSHLIHDAYPCAPLQQGLFGLSLQHQGMYVTHLAFELSPVIDIARLQQAWSCILAASDIMRTRMISSSVAGPL